MSDNAAAVVRDYYDALRDGDPLEPYFLADESTVKFGISEALFGFDDVRQAVREQTEMTTDWAVESDHLEIAERDGVATVADEVTMAWTDTEADERRRFETRWTGVLVPRADTGTNDDPDWLFATMHVSTADGL